MKKKLCILVLLLVMSAMSFAQQINISSLIVKPVLPSNVSQWDPTAVNGIATGTADTDGVRMAINIVRNGNSFVCGTTYENAMEMAGFATKVIRTSDVTGALGDCILPPGEYRLCVQFYSAGLPDAYEACRDFTVASPIVQPGQQQTAVEYSVPNLMAPADGSSIKEADAKKPITLRWTPAVPPPPVNDINYTIRIYEILSGQKPEQALRGNQPLLDLDLKGQTQTRWTIPSGTENIENRKFVWNVQATNNEGKPYGRNNGMSENYIFDRWGNLNHEEPKVVYPSVAKIPSCKNFKVNLVKYSKEPKKDGCCYDITISNNYNGLPTYSPKNFRIYTNNSTIISASTASIGWSKTPNTVPPQTNSIIWGKLSGNIPVGQTNLGTVCFDNIKKDPFYLKYEWLDSKRKVICKDSMQVACSRDNCINEVIRNGGFNLANIPGTMPSPGAVQYWTRGYGSPTINNDPNEGFVEEGYVKLSGNVSNGQAVAQALDPNNKIIQGKHYRLSVAFRFKTVGNTLDYAKIRAIAFNGNISSTAGSHPPPSSDVAIIGRSGKIRDCGDWSVIEFPVWTATKDFSNIAINAFTNDNTYASVWIDNITTCESPQEDCNELQSDASGNPLVPAGYDEAPPSGFTCQPEDDEEDYFNGSLQDLYPGYNGVNDAAFYSQNENSCFSIGGVVPPEVLNYDCDENLKKEGIDMTCEELQEMLNNPFVPTEIKRKELPITPTPNNSVKCDIPGPQGIENMSFHGRDVIYIHGLQLNHITDRIKRTAGATGHWPDNQYEYYSGYYKGVAESNMLPHINHYLRGPVNLNRYLIVVYDCSEPAEVAVHAVLSQIREAMDFGTGVQFNATDRRGKNCFGRDYVMISHSTGAIIADVALSIANKTKSDDNLKNQYGDIALISDRCKGRVSIQGAYSGSNLAKIALRFGSSLLGQTALAAMSASSLSAQTLSSLGSNQSALNNSVLVDLVPSITRQRWGSYINDIPIPVFCLAGGHPSAIVGSLKYAMHPGFDDGVLTMDSANGSNNDLSWGASYFTAAGGKVFDMGIPYLRASDYYKDQHHNMQSDHFAAASTSFLSPTGMVEPVISENISPQNHFNNHFSFIQSAKEHWFAATEINSGNTNCDYATTSPGHSTNNEEVLVVNNPGLFTSGTINPSLISGASSNQVALLDPGLIDPSIISQVGETLREKHRSHRWIKITWRHGHPKASIYWVRFYYWKRTYHKLIDDCMYDADYAYKYLFKQ